MRNNVSIHMLYFTFHAKNKRWLFDATPCTFLQLILAMYKVRVDFTRPCSTSYHQFPLRSPQGPIDGDVSSSSLLDYSLILDQFEYPINQKGSPLIDRLCDRLKANANPERECAIPMW